MKSSTETLIKALRSLSRDISCEDGVATAVIAEAADRIAELEASIRRLSEQDATLSVCDCNVTVTMDATLTTDERGAVAYYIGTGGPDCVDAALRGLLERTK